MNSLTGNLSGALSELELVARLCPHFEKSQERDLQICRNIFKENLSKSSEKADVMYVSNALLPDYEDNFDGVAEVLSKVLSLNSQHQQSEKVLHMLREIKAKKDAGNEFFKEEKYCTVMVLYGEALQLDEFHLKVIEKVHFSRTMAIQS